MGVKKVQYGRLNIKVLRFKDGRSSLELDQRGIRDITEVIGLNQLQDLEELNLSRNKISEITGLENLTNLKKLNLSRNQIKNINGLENLTNLIQLDLSKNQIKVIDGLENLTNLIQLNLSENQINEIKGLVNLSNLRILDISYNEILDSLTLKKLKENHLYLTDIDLRENPCFNSIVGVKAEFLKQNPSKTSILTYLSDLRLYKEEIEYDPKEEWRYLSDTEFCDIVGECLELNPVFFMNSLYTDLRRMLKRQFGEERRRVMEKYILEKFCLYDEEQILYECHGTIVQTDLSKDLNISVNNGTIFVTNNRIIAQGKLSAYLKGRPGAAPLTIFGWIGLPFRIWAERVRRNEIFEDATDQVLEIQGLPCYGYHFPIKNLLDLKQTRQGIKYHEKTLYRRSDKTRPVIIRLSNPNKEEISKLYWALYKKPNHHKRVFTKL